MSRQPPADPAIETAILVNEGAASGRSARVQEAVELAARVLRADVHRIATRDQATLRAWLEERMPAYQRAVIAGGDGSLGIAFNVASRHGVVLGYIPAGFGNATAHLLDLPRHPQALATVLAASHERHVDLVRVDGRLALFAGAGWDAAVAGRYARGGAKRLRGWVTAIAGSGGELVHRHALRVTVGGRPVHDGPAELVVVGTTPFYGRGMIVNPGARPDAGHFVVRAYPGPAPLLAFEAARWLLHIAPRAPGHAGTHALIESLDGRPVPLQADGDVIGAQERWELEIVPRAVRLIGRAPR